MNTNSMLSPASAVNESPRPANFTRRTARLTAKFWRAGHWHLIPLYHFLRLSDLAREGIERSGSYRFADHLYQNRASGRLLIGRLLDRVLLNTQAARGMRDRCVRSTRHLKQRLEETPGDLRLLAIPCGIPRDVTRLHSRTQRLHYTAMDVDESVLAAARMHLEADAPGLLSRTAFIHGDALNDLDFPEQPQDVIVSTGLGEFLDDAQLRTFYRNVFDSLAPGGTFYTSATRREGGSDYLMQAFELHAHYREQTDMQTLFAELPWHTVEYDHDTTGLQTFIVARK
ncbi:class I SAM-dependent methyltransferase [Prosthecobacter sp. SYSU 5D2]|uniref:class I SAM-dependent methyltransferase n=1 Tax=Prosthecobacter sp. SYSU 5D2 TaxID=3134134 RepID=UPI0031FF3567